MGCCESAVAGDAAKARPAPPPAQSDAAGDVREASPTGTGFDGHNTEGMAEAPCVGVQGGFVISGDKIVELFAKENGHALADAVMVPEASPHWLPLRSTLTLDGAPGADEEAPPAPRLSHEALSTSAGVVVVCEKTVAVSFAGGDPVDFRLTLDGVVGEKELRRRLRVPSGVSLELLSPRSPLRGLRDLAFWSVADNDTFIAVPRHRLVAFHTPQQRHVLTLPVPVGASVEAAFRANIGGTHLGDNHVVTRGAAKGPWVLATRPKRVKVTRVDTGATVDAFVPAEESVAVLASVRAQVATDLALPAEGAWAVHLFNTEASPVVSLQHHSVVDGREYYLFAKDHAVRVRGADVGYSVWGEVAQATSVMFRVRMDKVTLRHSRRGVPSQQPPSTADGQQPPAPVQGADSVKLKPTYLTGDAREAAWYRTFSSVGGGASGGVHGRAGRALSPNPASRSASPMLSLVSGVTGATALDADGCGCYVPVVSKPEVARVQGIPEEAFAILDMYNPPRQVLHPLAVHVSMQVGTRGVSEPTLFYVHPGSTSQANLHNMAVCAGVVPSWDVPACVLTCAQLAEGQVTWAGVAKLLQREAATASTAGTTQLTLNIEVLPKTVHVVLRYQGRQKRKKAVALDYFEDEDTVWENVLAGFADVLRGLNVAADEVSTVSTLRYADVAAGDTIELCLPPKKLTVVDAQGRRRCVVVHPSWAPQQTLARVLPDAAHAVREHPQLTYADITRDMTVTIDAPKAVRLRFYDHDWGRGHTGSGDSATPAREAVLTVLPRMSLEASLSALACDDAPYRVYHDTPAGAVATPVKELTYRCLKAGDVYAICKSTATPERARAERGGDADARRPDAGGSGTAATPEQAVPASSTASLSERRGSSPPSVRTPDDDGDPCE